MNRILVTLLLAMATAITALADFTEDQSRFTEACRAYEKGDYLTAASGFQALIESGSGTAAVHFNLANTHFKQDKLGWAVQHYLKCIDLHPDDRDARANLEYVRSVIQQGTPPRPPILGQLLRTFTLNTWTIAASLATSLWLLLTLACQINPNLKETLSIIRPILAFLAVLLLATSVTAQIQRNLDKSAVITVKTIDARFGPIEESAMAFTLRDGIEIEVLRVHFGWSLVREIGQREGWLPTASIQPIGRQARLLTASE